MRDEGGRRAMNEEPERDGEMNERAEWDEEMDERRLR